MLCYHAVHPTKPFASVTPAQFEQHLAWLKAHCDVIPFEETLAAARTRTSTRPAVALTFDDGYADNYEHAFPLLQQHGLSATFFLTLGLLEDDPAVTARFCTLRQAPAEEIRPLTWAQVEEMRYAGQAFGAHTYSHPNLARLGPAAALAELQRAKDGLTQRLGEAITTMAYPFGKPDRHFTSETMRLAEEAGYEQAAAVLFRRVLPTDSPFSVPRFFVTTGEVQALKDQVAGAWDLVGFWQEKAPAPLARLVSPLDYTY